MIKNLFANLLLAPTPKPTTLATSDFEKHCKVFLSSFAQNPLPMSTRKKGADIRLSPPPTRKSRTKHSHGEDGETLPESETGDVDQDTEDDDAEKHNAPIDMVSFQKQFAKMQKQFAQLTQHMPSTKPRASNDKVAAGPQSTTSSTTDETPYYHDEHLNRLAVVVGNASKEAQHDPLSRHTSPAWKANIVKYDKILLERDRNHINTHSYIACLLLHFYNRIEDAHLIRAVRLYHPLR